MEKRRWKGAVFNYPVGECREQRARFFLEVHIEGIRGYKHELQQQKFWIEVREKSSPCKWSKSATNCPERLEIFNASLWSKVETKCSLEVGHALSRELDEITFRNPRWPSENPCKLTCKQNIWFPELILAGSITVFCLRYSVPKKILIF